MLNIGPQELLVIILVALLVVGPKRLPELSRTIGKGLREFRKAQDEVTKTIRLGLDEAEPSGNKPVGTSAARSPDTVAGQETTAAPATDQQAPDEAADIARTLGRGLSEIRRARREIQRTFRVDLTDRPPRSSARPAPRPRPASQPSTPEGVSSPPAVPDGGNDPAPPRSPGSDGPAEPMTPA